MTKAGFVGHIGMISFVVPAHNEQAGIGRTLQAINDAGRMVGEPYEIIVVDARCRRDRKC